MSQCWYIYLPGCGKHSKDIFMCYPLKAVRSNFLKPHAKIEIWLVTYYYGALPYSICVRVEKFHKNGRCCVAFSQLFFFFLLQSVSFNIHTRSLQWNISFVKYVHTAGVFVKSVRLLSHHMSVNLIWCFTIM